MNTVNTLTTLMAEQARTGDLADIELTDSNGLQMLANYLVTMSSGAEIENTNAGFHEAVQEFANMVNNPEEFHDVFEKFQKIADAFSVRISDSYKELKHIKEEVTELVASSEALAKSRISEDPVLASLESDLSTITKLKPVRWDYLNSVNEMSLEQKLLGKLGLESIKEGDERYIHTLMIDHLPFGISGRKEDFAPIKITKNKMKEMVDSLAAKVPSLNKIEVQNILAHVLHLNRIDCNKAINSIQNLMSGESASKINQILRLTATYNAVLPYISAETFELSRDTMAAVKERVDAMQDCIDLTTYLCSYYRNHVWHDAIVVPGMLVNTDNWEEFSSADKDAIKKNPTLAIMQYKNKIYEDQDVPLSGIKGQSIIDRCETIAKEAYEIASANTFRCNQKKKDIYRDAFIFTAGKWLREQKKYSPEFFSSGEPESYARSIYDGNRDDAVENMFYTVILNSCYINTLTAQIHKRLRDEYKKAVARATTLTDRDIINIDTRVMADVVNEFMVGLLTK